MCLARMRIHGYRPARGEERCVREARLDVDIRLERVTKRFSDVVAVDDLSLEIGQGEFFSLLGPSGCGKTTTLRMIGGFEEPTAGTVYLRGRDVTDLPPYKRNVNTVFQDYALFPHMTVAQNIGYGLRIKGVPSDERRRRVKRALDMVRLSGLDQRRPNQLSGGQQQRVAIARALVTDPDLILADEPTGNLDTASSRDVLAVLRELNEQGRTIIVITHDPEVAPVAKRTVHMRDGQMVDEVAA